MTMSLQEVGYNKFSMVGTLLHTFQDNSDDPPLLRGSRAVVDALQYFRLDISANRCKQVSSCFKKREKIPTACPYSSRVRREYHWGLLLLKSLRWPTSACQLPQREQLGSLQMFSNHPKWWVMKPKTMAKSVHHVQWVSSSWATEWHLGPSCPKESV